MVVEIKGVAPHTNFNGGDAALSLLSELLLIGASHQRKRWPIFVHALTLKSLSFSS